MRMTYKRLGSQGEIHITNEDEFSLCGIRTTHPNWVDKVELSDKDPLLCVDCYKAKPIKQTNKVLEKMDLDKIYVWINKQYEIYASDQISESEYLSNLEYYKRRLALSTDEVKSPTSNEIKADTGLKAIPPDQVKTTSIEGLRKKLAAELKD